MDDKTVNSCLLLTAQAEGHSLQTIEGVGEHPEQGWKKTEGLHPLQQAFVESGAIQCGYCTPAQILAAIELGRRLNSASPDERPAIHSPKDAADLVLYEMSGLGQEHLWILILDTRNRVLDIKRLYQGSLNSSNVRIGEIFREAILRNAAAIIVAHNHPSGDPSPSPEDVALTRSLVETGKLLDIQVLDHLVIGGYKYISLKERHLGFS